MVGLKTIWNKGYKLISLILQWDFFVWLAFCVFCIVPVYTQDLMVYKKKHLIICTSSGQSHSEMSLLSLSNRCQVNLYCSKHLCKRMMTAKGWGGGTPHMKGVGMLGGILNQTPKGDQSGHGPSFFWPLKEIIKIYISNIFFYIFRVQP